MEKVTLIYYMEMLISLHVHLSVDYGGLDALYSKTGDHYLLGNYGFINHPVAYSKDDNGNISYKRKIYENR